MVERKWTHLKCSIKTRKSKKEKKKEKRVEKNNQNQKINVINRKKL